MAYSDKEKNEAFTTICEKIASEGLALRNILKLDGMPRSETFYRWMDADEDKSKQYARACAERSDKMFEDILVIADDQEGDVYKDKEGNEQTNHNVVTRSRLRIDSRKWMLSKLNPKKYGDVSKHILEGGDKNKPIVTTVISLGSGVEPK
jgi:hypothetical protein